MNAPTAGAGGSAFDNPRCQPEPPTDVTDSASTLQHLFPEAHCATVAQAPDGTLWRYELAVAELEQDGVRISCGLQGGAFSVAQYATASGALADRCAIMSSRRRPDGELEEFAVEFSIGVGVVDIELSTGPSTDSLEPLSHAQMRLAECEPCRGCCSP